MHALRWTVAFLLGLFFLSNAASAEDCTLKQFASLAMQPGAAIIEVSIGGKPFHFKVDTGGVYSMLNRGAADALGLKSHAITNGTELYDVGGNVMKNYVDAPDFTVGPIKLGDIKLIVRDRPRGPDGVDGILAPDVLAQFEVDFDFAAGKLNLFSQDHCEGKVVYWAKSFVDIGYKSDGSHIEIPMNLDGHDTWAMLDSGADATTLRENISRGVFGLDESSQGMEKIPDATPDDLMQYRYRFKSLSLNGLAVNNPLVYILPDRTLQSFRSKHGDKLDNDPVYGRQIQTPQMILGLNVLTKLHLFVSYKEHKLYLTAADAH